jgi:hypothetical protein
VTAVQRDLDRQFRYVRPKNFKEKKEKTIETAKPHTKISQATFHCRHATVQTRDVRGL